MTLEATNTIYSFILKSEIILKYTSSYLTAPAEEATRCRFSITKPLPPSTGHHIVLHPDDPSRGGNPISFWLFFFKCPITQLVNCGKISIPHN